MRYSLTAVVRVDRPLPRRIGRLPGWRTVNAGWNTRTMVRDYQIMENAMADGRALPPDAVWAVEQV